MTNGLALEVLTEISERIIRLHQILAGSNSFKMMSSFASLFCNRDVNTAGQSVQPYEMISDGVSIGFSDDAHIRVSHLPKYDVHLSPPGYDFLFVLAVDDIKTSNFLTLEADVKPELWREAKLFSFSAAGLGVWGIRGQVVLRLFRTASRDSVKEEWFDIQLLPFELGESRTSFNGSAPLEIPPYEQVDETRAAKLIVFLEPRNFQAEFHYIITKFST